MTVERKVLFPNVLVEVFSQGHLDAVFKEAERLGYTHVQDYNTVFQQQPKPWTTIAHFGSNAELFIFTAFTKEEANEWHKLARAGVPSDLICAPYGSNEFPECTCLGVDANTRKTCRMVKAYGGTCGKPFDKLLKATQEGKDKVIEWVRPKAENPIVTTVVRWLAVQGERVARVLKAGFNFLRGNK